MHRASYIAMIVVYCGVHGYLTLLGLLALLGGIVLGNKLALEVGVWFFVVEGGATLATIVAMFRPGHWAKLLAALHSAALALMMVAIVGNAYGDHLEVRRRSELHGAKIPSYFSLLDWTDYAYFSGQIVVVVTALTAFVTAETAIPPTKEGSSRKARDGAALRILALALNADGADYPERIAVATRAWSAFSNEHESAAALEKKLRRASATPEREAAFQEAVTVLRRNMLEAQKDWLVNTVHEICSIGGSIDQLSAEFLDALDQRLYLDAPPRRSLDDATTAAESTPLE